MMDLTKLHDEDSTAAVVVKKKLSFSVASLLASRTKDVQDQDRKDGLLLADVHHGDVHRHSDELQRHNDGLRHELLRRGLGHSDDEHRVRHSDDHRLRHDDEVKDESDDKRLMDDQAEEEEEDISVDSDHGYY